MYNCVQALLAIPYGAYFATEAHTNTNYRYLLLAATVCVSIPASTMCGEIGSLDRCTAPPTTIRNPISSGRSEGPRVRRRATVISFPASPQPPPRTTRLKPMLGPPGSLMAEIL